MNRLTKLLALLLLLSVIFGSLVSCEFVGSLFPENNGEGTGEGDGTGGEGEGELGELIDYASEVKLDKDSGRAWTEATVRTEYRDGETVYTGFVDGDTTHFKVPTSVTPTGLLKARYIAINTPESTGQIEPWGKAASNFTKSKLSSATSIILESDNGTWNPDSTGDRYLVWVWYKTAEMDDYRNLNLEILQAGLALASSYIDYVYADACRDILSQARAHKLCVHDKNNIDPDFYYGGAKPITLKELKANISDYVGTRVAFEAVVVKNVSQTAYVEEYDDESGTYFGMQVYYGFNLGSQGKKILQPGNRVLIVGSVQYYEAGGTYQVSDIYYFPTDPKNEKNIQKLSDETFPASYETVDAKTLLTGKVTVDTTRIDEAGNELNETVDLDYGFVAMHSTKTLKNLTIKEIYTTNKEDSQSKGAMSITCRAEDGTEIVLRTVVMYHSDGTLVTAAEFPVGSVINAKGIVDAYNGEYQLKVFTPDDIEFLNQ